MPFIPPATSRGISSIRDAAGSTKIKGDATLTGGTNVTLTQAGQDISIAAAGAASPLTLTSDDEDNEVPLTATQNDTTNNPKNVSMVNAGTGNNLFLDQNGNGTALNIDSEATSQKVINIEAVNTSGQPFYFRNQGEHTSNEMFVIIQEHASSTTDMIFLRNDGSGDDIEAASGAKLTSAGSWTNAPSYRRLKKKVGDLGGVVDKINSIDVDMWQYKDKVQEVKGVKKNLFKSDDSTHCSPYLDDFYNVFGIGKDDEVNPMDYIGVLFCAVKELSAKNNELEERLQTVSPS